MHNTISVKDLKRVQKILQRSLKSHLNNFIFFQKVIVLISLLSFYIYIIYIIYIIYNTYILYIYKKLSFKFVFNIYTPCLFPNIHVHVELSYFFEFLYSISWHGNLRVYLAISC